MRALLFCTLSVGCSCGDPRVGLDGGMEDAAMLVDAGDDAGKPDAGALEDAGSDAGMDASVELDAGMDAGRDAGRDAGLRDAGMRDAGTTGSIRFECVPAETTGDMSSGLVLSAMFWPGFRFQVPAGADVMTTRIGLKVQSSGGTIFGALIRLTGPTDEPDMGDLTGSDVIGTVLITLPGGASSTIEAAPFSTTLSPGWYAAMFGTGAFGATATSATVHSQSGDTGCRSGYGYPFSIRQSDGNFVLQAATPHFFVDAE